MLATPSIVMLLEFGRHERREAEGGAAVVRDVLDRLAFERERALAARRLQLAHPATDADALLDSADVQGDDPSRELVVRAHHDVGPLSGLETLTADPERVGVGPDDREHEAPLVIRRGGERVALGAARERHGRAWKHPTQGVFHRAEYGRTGRLRSEGHGSRGQGKPDERCYSRCA
jgi:hypothetical protein